MFGSFGVGFVVISEGFAGALTAFVGGTKPSAAAAVLLNTILGGLEMFFLAPLPFLAFISITRLFRAVISRQPERLDFSYSFITEVKRLITGLMIAAVATDLIHHIIGGVELEPITTAAALGLILALAVFNWSLHSRTPHRASWPPMMQDDP